ncbi:hypothetical protein GPECTOR_122g448 [Gonium pectorale]|uniref:WDHD1/CFT4 second beta-propeller domain-containing protein n=1 Tax=Gonium pectorale TaxID=33097 RepID=A0A150FYP9_GONPE|nr:hypothetical protein GPECTOR_122g448 [Gonium pectorale]|eukprot:KXZ42707.1 hypothetical protein GPECTOR_122g448 [Gonium pectorale]
MKDVQLRLTTGHEPGQASVAYARTAEGLSLVTAGADGRVCLRDPLVLEPTHSAKVAAPPATILAVDPRGKFVAVGDDQYVKLFKLPALTGERTACRFSLPLRALAFSPDGARLAAAGDDNLIKLVDVKDCSTYRSLSMDDYVLSLAWDPEGTYLAASLRGGHVAVSQLLRLFSLGGSQTGLSRLEGPPVAMAAAGSLLAVVYHAGPPNPHTKSQQLAMSLYDTTSLSLAFSAPLPLSPGSSLTWLGFTDDHCLPAVADTAGVVAAATEKPPATDSHKRKPAQTYNNPFARKAPKLGK